MITSQTRPDKSHNGIFLSILQLVCGQVDATKTLALKHVLETLRGQEDNEDEV